MSCSSCKYLKEGDKKEGTVCGAQYYCEKIKAYIDASNNNCNDYEKSYARSNYTCSEMYDDGNNYYDDTTPNGVYVLLLIIMIILALIFNL